jgi:hypothetical protein
MAAGREADEVLLAFAKSDLIDPDESSPERTKAREQYMDGLKALYPKAFRRARGRSA